MAVPGLDVVVVVSARLEVEVKHFHVTLRSSLVMSQ